MSTRAALVLSIALAVLCTAKAFADPTSVPTPNPEPTPTPALNIEGGASTDQLTNNRGTWNEQNLQAILTGKISACGVAANDERFGYDDHWYEAGVYLPTNSPHGTVELLGGFSPEHNVLPGSQYGAGYDLREGGGFGYQATFTNRNYPAINGDPAVNVQTGTLGFDKYFQDQRVAFFVNGANLSNVNGLAISYGGKWNLYAPNDTLNVGASLGRDVENTGTSIAVYHETTIDVDELHWLSHRVALHAGAEFDNLAGAYGRFEVRLGVRERI
jgi:YaiO family outer membrane protein